MATVGIDIGGTKVAAVRLEGGAVVESRRAANPHGDLVAAAGEAARSVWADDVVAVGVGVAGLVRFPEGTLVWGPHVSGTEVPIREDVEANLGVPVFADNDANLAAFGEMRLGAAQGYEHVLLVTLGTGIGGAVIIAGQIYRGISFAGEWGHMVYDPKGLLCDCGKRGCWETVASGPALVRFARESLTLNPESSLARRLPEDYSAEDITAAADAGDEIARGLVAQVGAEFGRGLCSLIAIFDPEAIVISGGLGSVGESLVGPARRVAADALHGGAYRLLPPILVATLGPEAGAVGAASMAQAIIDNEITLEP